MADSKAATFAEKKIALKEAEDALDMIFCNMFESHPDGQRILLDLQSKFYDRSSVMGSPVDVNGTMVREGERNVLLYIHGRIARFLGRQK